MQEASDRVGVILVALVAAILYGISVLALWALGPAIAFTVLAAALYLRLVLRPTFNARALRVQAKERDLRA